jgi:hypothetical protein
VSAAIAYPVTVSLRVPGEHEVERVPFEFRDVVLPPRPGGPFRTQAPTLDETALRSWDPPGGAWSAWSEPAGGLSCRARLPGRSRRDRPLDAVLLLRFDPAPSPPEGEFFDPRHIEDLLRLRLRDRSDGGTVEVPLRRHERVLEVPDPGQKADPEWIRLGDGAVREWAFRFPLVSSRESAAAGEYEASIVCEVPPGTVPPSVWSGTVSTPPLSIVLAEAEPADVWARLPRALRLRTGARKGTVEVCFGPAESESVLLHPRPGFSIGTSVKARALEDRDFDYRDFGWGTIWSAVSTVVDTLEPGATGPLDTVYEVEVFDVPLEGVPDAFFPPGRDGYRTLWKRTFRVRASAAEIEALRR